LEEGEESEEEATEKQPRQIKKRFDWFKRANPYVSSYSKIPIIRGGK
jgi:hypothetical protein